MDKKKIWIEEAKASRRILYNQWLEEGQPLNDFYTWLLEHVEAGMKYAREKNKMDAAYEQTIG